MTYEKNSQENHQMDFTYFPFSHGSIFQKIILYAGFEVALQCKEVCPVWELYFQPLNIWHQLLRNEVRTAQSLVSELRCNSLLDEFIKFIIYDFERDVHIFTYSSLVLNENITLSPRVINFGKRLSQKLELAQKIKLIPCDLDSHLQHIHSFMMIAEARFEIGLEKNRIKNRRFWQKDKEFYEFMLTSSNEFGLHPETYFQAVRITEFVNFGHHPVTLWDKKFMAVLSLAVASSETEKNWRETRLTPFYLFDYFFDETHADYLRFKKHVDQHKVKLKYFWYHPSARMFLNNFLRMMKEEDSEDLVIVATYFVQLLTGYTGTQSDYLAPSLIALGSLAAARQMLDLSYRHPDTQGPVQSEEEVMEVRDKALDLHNEVRDSVYQESVGDSSLETSAEPEINNDL